MLLPFRILLRLEGAAAGGAGGVGETASRAASSAGESRGWVAAAGTDTSPPLTIESRDKLPLPRSPACPPSLPAANHRQHPSCLPCLPTPGRWCQSLPLTCNPSNAVLITTSLIITILKVISYLRCTVPALYFYNH